MSFHGRGLFRRRNLMPSDTPYLFDHISSKRNFFKLIPPRTNQNRHRSSRKRNLFQLKNHLLCPLMAGDYSEDETRRPPTHPIH